MQARAERRKVSGPPDPFRATVIERLRVLTAYALRLAASASPEAQSFAVRCQATANRLADEAGIGRIVAFRGREVRE